VSRALEAADVVVAYTRSGPVLACLRARARRVLAHDPAPPPAGPHSSSWLARAVVPLAGTSPPDPPPLEITDDERREAESLTADLPPGFLAIHPGSGSPAKNWPLDRFVEAASRIGEGRRWLLALGPAEADLPPPRGAVVGRGWPPRILAAVVARAGLYIGNDSGASHLAAAAGAPTVALFGPTDPALWAPVGRAVATLRGPRGVVAEIAVEDVCGAARRAGATAAAKACPPPGR
jgi:heptosyltransferase-2